MTQARRTGDGLLTRRECLAAAGSLAMGTRTGAEGIEMTGRKPASEAELEYWLRVMAVDHHYSRREMAVALGQSPHAVGALLRTHGAALRRDPAPEPLRVLPYPGGRHPRLGFLDGAVNPQRDTKVSIFTPWDPASYVVVDTPEAIWANGELIYLAHTHVETRWTRQRIALPELEWERRQDRSYVLDRPLPDGVRFASWVRPGPDRVRMELTLHNGSDRQLRDLRVQVCVMLGYCTGFAGQTGDNKRQEGACIAAHDVSGRHWVLTAWQPLHRTWNNPPCPCIHSDPVFPDCPPGGRRRVRGVLAFHEGKDHHEAMASLRADPWLSA